MYTNIHVCVTIYALIHAERCCHSWEHNVGEGVNVHRAEVNACVTLESIMSTDFLIMA